MSFLDCVCVCVWRSVYSSIACLFYLLQSATCPPGERDRLDERDRPDHHRSTCTYFSLPHTHFISNSGFTLSDLLVLLLSLILALLCYLSHPHCQEPLHKTLSECLAMFLVSIKKFRLWCYVRVFPDKKLRSYLNQLCYGHVSIQIQPRHI